MKNKDQIKISLLATLSLDELARIEAHVKKAESDFDALIPEIVATALNQRKLVLESFQTATIPTILKIFDTLDFSKALDKLDYGKIETASIKSNKHDVIAKERREAFYDLYGAYILGKINLKTGKVTTNSVLEQFQKKYNKVKDETVEGVQELYKEYSYAIFFMYSPTAIRNNLVQFRNVIKKEGGKYKANAIEAFTIEKIYKPVQISDIKKKQALKKRLQKGETDSQKTDPSIVENQIAELKDKLDNKKYKVAKNQDERQVRAYHLVALLSLATGRRFTEIIKTFTMTKRGTRLTFSGLLKGNSETIKGNIISLEYKETKKYLMELRKNLDAISKEDGKPLIADMTENQINSRYSRVFNNAIKRLGFTNIKALRHNYSVAGSALFRIKNEDMEETIEETITRILGHKEMFTSALNYA